MDTTTDAKLATQIAASDIKWESMDDGAFEIARLWGNRATGPDWAQLLKWPAGYESGWHAHTADYRAIVIQGIWVHKVEGDTAPPKELAPGS